MKPQSEIEKWEADFDKEYGGQGITVWAVGIVAESMIHEQTEPFGTDASYITKKLVKDVEALRQEDLKAFRGMVEEAKITQRPLGWLNDDMVEGYNQALSYILSKLPELD